MITTNEYFKNELEEIANKIHEFEQISLDKSRVIYEFKVKSIYEDYYRLVNSFPYDIISSSSKIELSLKAIETNIIINDANEEESISIEYINKIKDSRRNYTLHEYDKYLINDLLDEFFHTLVYNYMKFIDNAKEYPFFANINDEKIILNNLLKLYESIIKNEQIQLNIFWGIILTKEISDKIVIMLIDFIKHRLAVLDPTNLINNQIGNSSINVNISETQKLVWKGTQLNLLELFVKLIENNWIPEIEYQNGKQYSTSILSLFDIEGTKKHESSDSANSFYQIFKGVTVKGKKTYPKIENNKYKKKFATILNNEQNKR